MASVPAWKRLGLKLKGSSDSSAPAPAPASAPKPAYSSSSSSSYPPKRKFDSATGSNNTPLRSSHGSRSHDSAAPSSSSSSFKKPRFDSAPAQANTHRKSVSFSAETSAAPAPVKAPKKPKTKKPKTAAAGTGAPVAKTTDITPSLEYLRLWKSARAAWKFNKNHQTLLIKYMYDNGLVPARDIGVFYDYIRDIQGYARVRLVEAARAVQKADMEHVTGVAPPAGQVVAPTAQQMAANAKYHVRLAEVLRDYTTATSKRVDEAKLAAASGDDADAKEMLKRVVKRMRAEAVIAELADTEKEGAAAPVPAPVPMVVEQEEKEEVKPAPAVKANGKKVRSRKKRIMADSDSSSSESDSDSDSDSDSEPKKTKKVPAKKAAKKAESSSSESESSSDSDSD